MSLAIAGKIYKLLCFLSASLNTVHLQGFARSVRFRTLSTSIGLHSHPLLHLNVPPWWRRLFHSCQKSYRNEVKCICLGPMSQATVIRLVHTVPAVSLSPLHLSASLLSGKSSAALGIRHWPVLFLQVLQSFSRAWAREHRLIPSCWGRRLLSSPRCPR